MISKKNIKRHMKTIHNTEFLFTAVCCDREKGLYMVKRSQHGGIGFPVHVLKKINYIDGVAVNCEVDSCRDEMSIAARSGMKGRECQHLLLVNNALFPESLQLDVEFLRNLGNQQGKNVLKANTIESCIDKQEEALANQAQFVVEWDDTNHLHLSIYDGTFTRFLVKSRLVVTYKKLENRLDCRCRLTRVFCLHKAIALWYLHQTNKLSSDSVDLSTTSDKCESNSGESLVNDAVLNYNLDKMIYPPEEEDTILKMVDYMKRFKKVPFPLPNDAKAIKKEKLLIVYKPKENDCYRCGSNLDGPHRISHRANILTMEGFIEGVETFFKLCRNCNLFYRYQEYEDGVHNFDDIFFLGLDVCAFLRESTVNHVAIGTICNILQGLWKIKIDFQKVFTAYAHFEALSDRTYEFNCVKCGHFPTILIADLNRKVAFNCRVPDEALPDENDESSDFVNCDEFWSKIVTNSICTGFPNRSLPSVKVTPSLAFWAPYIGQKTRVGYYVVNSEHRKVHRETGEPEIDCRELSQERLLEQMFEAKMPEVRRLARKVGVSAKGSKIDLINRMKEAIGRNDEKFNKIFKKMFGRSGGWLTLACTHGVIYAVKFLLRSESPRDYIDMIRSLKHKPNVFIVDMAHMVASHGNRYEEGFFSPYEGRVAEATPQNIENALEGNLQISFPWLLNNPSSKNDLYSHNGDCHPISGSNVRLALFDRFHEKNTSCETEALRRITCVAELAGQINSEVVEQIHGSFGKNIHFMNQLSPTNHIFLFRSIIDLRNEARNAEFLKKIEEKTKMVVNFDKYGRAIFGHNYDLYSDTDNHEDSWNFLKTASVCESPEPYIPQSYCDPDKDEINEINLANSELSLDRLSPGVCAPKNFASCFVGEQHGFFSEQRESFEVETNKIVNPSESSGQSSISFPLIGQAIPNRAKSVANSLDESWLPYLSLDKKDKKAIEDRKPLTVATINAALSILKSECKEFAGMHDMHLLPNCQGDGRKFIQILELRLRQKNIHWGTISNVLSGEHDIVLYDSATRTNFDTERRQVRYPVIIEDLACRLRNLPLDKMGIIVADVDTVKRDCNTGVAAIFHAVCLSRKADPKKVHFNYSFLRKLLIKCLENGTFKINSFDGTPRSQYRKKDLYQINVPLYCHCKMPDMNLPMTKCSSCTKWFHDKCEEGDKQNPNWLCKGCFAEISLSPKRQSSSPRKRKFDER
eukprot:gene4136-20321_t